MQGRIVLLAAIAAFSVACGERPSPTEPSFVHAEVEANESKGRPRAVRVAPSSPCENPASVIRCNCEGAGAFVRFKDDVAPHLAAAALAAKYSIAQYDLTSWGNGMQVHLSGDVIYQLKCEPAIAQIYLNRYPSPSGSVYCTCPRYG